MSNIHIDAQIACVKREIRMREQTYPRWVSSGKMKQEVADIETARMRAVLETLMEIEKKGRLL